MTSVHPSVIRDVLIAILGLVAFAPYAAGQDAMEWRATFDAGAPPPRLIVDAPYLRLTVRGHDSDSIIVRARYEDGAPGLLPQPAFARNFLQFTDRLNNRVIELEVLVPHRTAVLARTSNAAPVQLFDIHGSVEVENSNAGIVLEGLRGSVVAATSNGPIDATFDRTPVGVPLSFLTSNGAVTIWFPDEPDLDLHLQTDNSGVETEFVVTPLNEPATIGGDGGRVLRGQLGKGGPLLRVRTDNGQIVLRQSPRIFVR